MDVQIQIKIAQDFLDKEYLAEIHNNIRKGQKFLVIDFKKLILFSPELAEFLLDNFEDCLKAFEVACEQFDGISDMKIRLTNVPKTEHSLIWTLRADKIDNLICLRGYIRKISDVTHGVKVAKFECPQCGNIIPVLQTTQTFIKPDHCGCGRQGNFREIGKDVYDLQKVVLEEDPSEITSTQKPRRMLVLLKNDLCRKEIDKVLQPSTKVLVIGIIKEKQIKNTIEFTKYIEANNIEILDETFGSLKFTTEEIAKFEEIAKTPTLYEDMAQSVVPTIYGHDLVKKAVLLQLIGGNHLYDGKELEERGTIHILLVGSPGSGKTKILKRAIQFIPNSRFTGGRGTSGVGLVAAVVKDEELGGFTLDAGAVPMCNKSMCAIDELDKMQKQDIAMMNNAMNDLTVSIDKANIHGILETDTMILAAANPKERVFDKRELIWKQIGLPKDHLDRYDLIFPVENMESEKDQRKVAGIIFSKYKKSKRTEPVYPKELVKRYIAYARQKIFPVMGELSEDYITDNFINLVKPRSSEEDQAYFSSRLLTNIIRLATAAAKTRLSQKVEEGDALLAINILIDSLKKQDIIRVESGKLTVDIERMEAIIPKPKRDRKSVLVKKIKEHEGKNNKKMADIEEVLRELKAKGFSEDEFDEFIEKMKRDGEIYEPVRGKIKTIG